MHISNFNSNSDLFQGLNLNPSEFIYTDSFLNTLGEDNNFYNLYFLETTRQNEYECPHCGSISKHISKGFNNKRQSIKYRIDNDALTILLIKKRRFICSDCSKTFTPILNIIKRGCNISYNLKDKIKPTLATTKTLSGTATTLKISNSTTYRYIEEMNVSNSLPVLPESLGMDEFLQSKGLFRCIITDLVKKKIVAIIPSRKLDYLINHFLQYSLEERKRVKRVVIDMYPPYISLDKKVFPNAKIVFDRFHIIQ